MNALDNISSDTVALPALVDRAARALAGARTAAEVLEARDQAGMVYDLAKKAARLAKAKGAHDTLVAAAHRAQADALEIEAGAKRRLADEYDAAQARGEVAKHGETLRNGPDVPKRNVGKATAADVGLSRKDIHEARILRDAEVLDPGVIRRALVEAVEAGEEPTKARVRRAAAKAAKRKKPKRKPRHAVAEVSQHDRDLRMLLSFWELACETAKQEFISIIAEKKISGHHHQH